MDRSEIIKKIKNGRIYAHDLDEKDFDLEISKLFVEKGTNIGNIPIKFITDDIFKECIKYNIWNFKHIPYHILTYEICEIAVSKYGPLLNEIPLEFVDYKMIILAISESKTLLNINDLRSELLTFDIINFHIKNIDDFPLADSLYEQARTNKILSDNLNFINEL